jgi:hypothetical protein
MASATNSNEPRRSGARADVSLLVIAALVLSACLIAPRSDPLIPRFAAWFAFLPVFQAIQILRPRRAFIAGAIWGLSLFGFGVLPGPPLGKALPEGIMLVLGPATYVCWGAWLTAAIGFRPGLLAIGWAGLAMAIDPRGVDGSPSILGEGDGLRFGPPAGTFLSMVAAFGAAYASVLALRYLDVATVEILRAPMAAVGIGCRLSRPLRLPVMVARPRLRGVPGPRGPPRLQKP